MMHIFIWMIMIIAFLYAARLALQFWKEKSKAGSIAVFIMAIAIIVIPIFTILR